MSRSQRAAQGPQRALRSVIPRKRSDGSRGAMSTSWLRRSSAAEGWTFAGKKAETPQATPGRGAPGGRARAPRRDPGVSDTTPPPYDTRHPDPVERHDDHQVRGPNGREIKGDASAA